MYILIKPCSPDLTGQSSLSIQVDRAQLEITANLRTKILDFRGFDSGRTLISRGGMLMSMGDFPGSFESTIIIITIIIIQMIMIIIILMIIITIVIIIIITMIRILAGVISVGRLGVLIVYMSRVYVNMLCIHTHC